MRAFGEDQSQKLAVPVHLDGREFDLDPFPPAAPCAFPAPPDPDGRGGIEGVAHAGTLDHPAALDRRARRPGPAIDREHARPFRPVAGMNDLGHQIRFLACARVEVEVGDQRLVEPASAGQLRREPDAGLVLRVEDALGLDRYTGAPIASATASSDQ